MISAEIFQCWKTPRLSNNERFYRRFPLFGSPKMLFSPMFFTTTKLCFSRLDGCRAIKHLGPFVSMFSTGTQPKNHRFRRRLASFWRLESCMDIKKSTFCPTFLTISKPKIYHFRRCFSHNWAVGELYGYNKKYVLPDVFDYQ